jgi:hypothetical protein
MVALILVEAGGSIIDENVGAREGQERRRRESREGITAC